MAFDKNIAKDAIYHHIFQHCVATTLSDGKNLCFGKTFISTSFGKHDELRIGDLVRLTCMNVHKWSICWLVDMRHDNQEFLCESVETGELCWWGNVGIEYFDRETLRNLPQWRWTDRQHKFNKRWMRVCYKKHDAYIRRPLQVSFGENHQFTIGTRTSHGLDDFRPTETFPDWRKFTMKQMSDCYLRCVERHNDFSAKARLEKEET